ETDLELAIGGGKGHQDTVRCQIDQYGRPVGIAVREGDLEPENVVPLRDGKLGEAAVLAGRRVPAVGTHHQICPELARPVVGTGPHADHPAVLAQEIAHGDAALELERGV